MARLQSNEYLDFYKLNKPCVAANGVYPIQVRELETEDSFTDYAALLEVDHSPDVAVAPDANGNLVGYRPAALLAPRSATSGLGASVLPLVWHRMTRATPRTTAIR